MAPARRPAGLGGDAPVRERVGDMGQLHAALSHGPDVGDHRLLGRVFDEGRPVFGEVVAVGDLADALRASPRGATICQWSTCKGSR